MKKLFLILFLLFFSFSQEVLASSAKSVVKTQVEGDQVEVYQSVETTINGETIKKESNQPGKLELEMKKVGENEPTISFSQESASPETTLGLTWFNSFVEFFRNLFLQGFALVRGLTSR